MLKSIKTRFSAFAFFCFMLYLRYNAFWRNIWRTIMNGKNEMVTVPSILNAVHTEGRQKESDRYKEQIHSYIKAHKLEMMETLKALIKIPS